MRANSDFFATLRQNILENKDTSTQPKTKKVELKELLRRVENLESENRTLNERLNGWNEIKQMVISDMSESIEVTARENLDDITAVRLALEKIIEDTKQKKEQEEQIAILRTKLEQQKKTDFEASMRNETDSLSVPIKLFVSNFLEIYRIVGGEPANKLFQMVDVLLNGSTWNRQKNDILETLKKAKQLENPFPVPTQTTNIFNKDSVTFQAGSTMMGDVNRK